MTAVEVWVSKKDPHFCSSGLMALKHRWSMFITLEGNYIEKEEVDLNLSTGYKLDWLTRPRNSVNPSFFIDDYREFKEKIKEK